MITHSDTLEQIEKLKTLEPGWLDGYGEKPSVKSLEWLKEKLNNQHDIFPAYIYPTTDGGVLLEWKIDHFDISLEIDLVTKSGYFHEMNLETRRFNETNLDLNDTASWELIGYTLTAIAESRKIIKESLRETEKWRLTDEELEELLK